MDQEYDSTRESDFPNTASILNLSVGLACIFKSNVLQHFCLLGAVLWPSGCAQAWMHSNIYEINSVKLSPFSCWSQISRACRTPESESKSNSCCSSWLLVPKISRSRNCVYSWSPKLQSAALCLKFQNECTNISWIFFLLPMESGQFCEIIRCVWQHCPLSEYHAKACET